MPFLLRLIRVMASPSQIASPDKVIAAVPLSYVSPTPSTRHNTECDTEDDPTLQPPTDYTLPHTPVAGAPTGTTAAVSAELSGTPLVPVDSDFDASEQNTQAAPSFSTPTANIVESNFGHNSENLDDSIDTDPIGDSDSIFQDFKILS